VIALVGATGTGKSALAVELAEKIDAEIINADALQVYRGLEIGTAKPSDEQRRRVPHHLLDILEPEQAFSAGDFARRARTAIAEIEARGRFAIVVGGSGLYYRSLFEGLSRMPPVDLEIRQTLEAELASGGLALLRAELENVDPATARRLTRGDTQRILRALEVWRATGRTLASWQAEKPPEELLERLTIGLTLSRTILYDRLAVRVRSMVASGWIEEVSRLLDRGVDPGVPAFQAIGYRQIVAHLLEGRDLQATLDEILRATRHYAKRQETWFRRERDVLWLDCRETASFIPFLLHELEKKGARI
jgi:tRNA dimethylallyltransferase